MAVPIGPLMTSESQCVGGVWCHSLNHLMLHTRPINHQIWSQTFENQNSLEKNLSSIFGLKMPISQNSRFIRRPSLNAPWNFFKSSRIFPLSLSIFLIGGRDLSVIAHHSDFSCQQSFHLAAVSSRSHSVHSLWADQLYPGTPPDQRTIVTTFSFSTAVTSWWSGCTDSWLDFRFLMCWND